MRNEQDLPASDRAAEIRRFLAEVAQAAAELDGSRDQQQTLQSRLRCHEFYEALQTDAWSRRACALMDGSALKAGQAAVAAARELAPILARSNEMQERAAYLMKAARWIALRLEHQKEKPMPHADIREAVCETARRMLKDGLVRLTSGNISCRIPGTDTFAVTPSGMDYETLQPADICIVNLAGQVVDGQRRPSSEMAMHRLTYERRPEIGGIVHTHSIYASAFACLGQEMPVISTELAALVGGTIRCAPYARAGTEEFAQAAVQTLGPESVAVLFQNHGVMAAGKTLKEAYSIAVGLEEAAMIYFLARQMGEPIIIPAQERERMFREFRTSYGQPGTGEE